MEPENKNTEKKKKLPTYIDPTGELPSSQLELGAWYLRHKILLGQIGVGILIAFCAVTISFSLWGWGKYLLVDYTQDEQLFLNQTLELQDYKNLQTSYGAEDLLVADTRVFRGASDMYDFVANITNPNERWVAKLKYHFDYTNGETDIAETVLLPGAKRPVAFFGHESNIFPSNIRFIIDEISWKSIDPHKIFDVASYANTRLMFSVDNFVFNSPEAKGILVPSINFDLYNDSAYNFWQGVFYIELLNGGQTVGYVFLSVDQFMVGEKRAIDLRYFGGNLNVTDIRLHPVIDVFDDNTFMDPNNDF